MDTNFLNIFQQLMVSETNKDGLQSPAHLKRILNLVIANRFIYDYLDSPTECLSEKHSQMYKHIRDSIPNDIFIKISTYLHVVIDQYCSHIEKNPLLQDMLRKRYKKVTDFATTLKEEMNGQLSDDESEQHIPSDHEIWVRAESYVTNNTSFGFSI